MKFEIPIISAAIGVIILFFGRKLFWLCVAAVGFAAGIEMAPHLVQQPSPLLALSFALVLGFLGALLSLFLQKIAIAIAGFVAGGKLALAIVAAFLVNLAPYFWLTLLIGGVIGAVLLLVLFDWALIFLSAIIGAYLVEKAFALPSSGTAILFLVLVIAGVLVQAASFRRSRVAVVE